MTDAVTSRRVVQFKHPFSRTERAENAPLDAPEGTVRVLDDDLVVEEPMEMRLDGTSLAVVMRTPGDDADLVLGFAITEGIVTTPEAIEDVVFLGDGRWDLVTVEGVTIDPAQFQRNFYSTSSCGVCGKASIDAIRITGARPPDGPVVSTDTILTLPSRRSSIRPPSNPPEGCTRPPPSTRPARYWRCEKTSAVTTRWTR